MKHTMLRLVLAVSASAAVLPSVVCAAPLSFLNGTILLRIPAKDVPGFRQAIGSVLNTAADKSTTQWSSSHHRGNAQVNVALRPLETVQTRSAGECRLLDATVSQQTQQEDWRFWFCKQPDGTWKASAS